ncbi:MAG TPA: helix-turn-helix transcriptional regulator [Sphingomonadaceae bacterium]|nr:helix-turn-helix transcriptional regulator [Sphingomonadaceae bacterium]
MPSSIERVTENQRECLRLVWRHYESKQIARELNITPFAVDGRIKNAMRTLQVEDRFEAARMIVQAEAEAGVQSAIYPPSDIPGRPLSYSTSDPSMHGERQADLLALEEAQAPYSLYPRHEASWFSPPLPSHGRTTNDLTLSARLLWIAALAIGTALAFGALAAGLEALSRLA